MSKIILTQGDILNILQNSNSVPLGTPIWNSDEEYSKLKAIVECAVAYTHPIKELTDEERLDFTKAYFNIHPDALLSEQFRIKLYELEEFAKAILRKAQKI